MLLENKKLIIIIVIVLLLSISGLTLAYFVGQIGSGATTNVTLTSKTVDNLTFSKGADITIGPVNQANFSQGSGNKSGSTTASATLKANTGNNSATETYNVYLKINTNTFEYTTSNNTAELVLKVTNPAGNTQTISNLTSVTSGGVTGYDITTKQSIIPIATNYAITTTSTKTDTWTAQVYFINLNSDQQENTSKTFNAELVIEKREPITVTFDANGGSVSQTSKEVTYGTFYEDLPTPTKSGATFLGWNGKNKFNYLLASCYNCTVSDGIVTQEIADSRLNLQWKIQGYNNRTYITTFQVLTNNSTGLINSSFTNSQDFNLITFGLNGQQRDTLVYYGNSKLSNNIMYIISFTLINANQGSIKWKNIQLEEGTTATLYEPYYVTSDVAVTQESDHTLTAVWQEN